MAVGGRATPARERQARLVAVGELMRVASKVELVGGGSLSVCWLSERRVEVHRDVASRAMGRRQVADGR
jgi:hypothetical protein